ncbi:N-acetylmuramoyl-L-alanine amidase [Bacillus sp. FSL W7-1360]
MQIKQDLIPASASNRPQAPIKATHITIHETANTSRGANAATHARYLKGADAQRRNVSWHYTVDDKEIYQHLPDREMGWHAGANGNRQSIGIELCVNSDGDFNQTKQNAAWLVRKLMSDHKININNVVTHKHWTNKNCPANLLREWGAFKQLIAGHSNLQPPANGRRQQYPPAKRGEGIVDYLKRIGVDSSFSNRRRLAEQHGIRNYTGTAAQNTQLLRLLSGASTNAAKVSKTATKAAPKPQVTPVRKKVNLPNAVYRAKRPYPRGTGVRQVQEALAKLHYYPDKGAKNNGIDGVYGPKTADAVRRFQSMHGLGQDGVYGPKTRAQMLKLL